MASLQSYAGSRQVILNHENVNIRNSGQDEALYEK